MASDSRDYGSPEYWDQFYKSSGGDGVREWFHGFELLRELFERHLRRTDRILMVGCGNSALSADMFAAGYENIVNIDASMVVIRQMLRRQPEMDWRHMDVCNMAEFRTGSFDAVIDKGTLDAILCGQTAAATCGNVISEVARVLNATRGVYILISNGAPAVRLEHLELPHYKWTATHTTLPSPDAHVYAYIMTRSPSE